MEQTKKEKILDAHAAMSFVIKALYFAKPESKSHRSLQLLMNYEDVMFRPIPSNKVNLQTKDIKIIEESDDERLKRIQQASSLAQFDFRIYDELKEIKKEIR
jgi:hypothetical protein